MTLYPTIKISIHSTSNPIKATISTHTCLIIKNGSCVKAASANSFYFLLFNVIAWQLRYILLTRKTLVLG